MNVTQEMFEFHICWFCQQLRVFCNKSGIHDGKNKNKKLKMDGQAHVEVVEKSIENVFFRYKTENERSNLIVVINIIKGNR